MIVRKSKIDKVVNELLCDKIVAFPTETVFGLAIKGDKEENYNKLVKLKSREEGKPFTLMCSKIEMVSDFVFLDEISKKIIKKFMPGPITLILKTSKKVEKYLDLATNFVGIRIPDDKFILELIDKVGTFLLVPSANPATLPPAKTSEEVYNYFGEEILIVEGKSVSNIPSTIIKINEEKIELIREGEIKLKEILEAVK